MKTIIISGQQFEYKVFSDANEWGECEWTEFYQGTRQVEKRRFLFFGKKFTEIIPNLVFEVHINIEDPGYTKEEVRKKLEKQVELLNRKKEIERGEII